MSMPDLVLIMAFKGTWLLLPNKFIYKEKLTFLSVKIILSYLFHKKVRMSQLLQSG